MRLGGIPTALKLAALVALTIAAVLWPGNPGPAQAEGVEIQAITTGEAHSCALTTAGGVKCWGSNWSGEVGAPGNTPPTPVDVVGLGSGVAAVAAGGVHTCALTTAGGVKCWGRNILGELGTDTSVPCFFEPCTPFPEDVRELASGVAAIAAGGFHTCVVTTAGGLKCWGNGEYGQVGDGTVGDGDPLTLDNQRLSPVQVIGLESGVAASAAGSFHTCALTTAGGVKCWGQNDRGQLGDGQACGTACPGPVEVAGLDSGVAAIAAGSRHTCAVTTAGKVKCWGENGAGGLGDGTTTRSLTPVDVCQDYDETAQQCLEVLSGMGAVTAGGGTPVG